MDTNPNPPTFEAALAQLEKIVDSMEAGDVPLAEMIAQYEAGTKLLQVCEARLKDAEMKIEQLKKQNGSATFSTFEQEKPQE